MNGQKLFFFLAINLFGIALLRAQHPVKLEELFEKAISQGTSANQSQLINQVLAINQANANANYLPKLSINGAASYQTDVTSFKVPIPGIEILPPFKDQYKVTLDLQQNIYDGGSTTALKKFNAANTKVELAKVEHENTQLKEAIAQLYYSAALLDRQKENIEALRRQVVLKIERSEELLKMGTTTKLALQQLQTKILELDQQLMDLKFKKNGIISGINLLTGLSLVEDTSFEMASTVDYAPLSNITRSELKLFQAQQELLSNSTKLIKSKYAPKLFLIGTLGYGRPGLNFLARDFDTYGILGLNLKIPIDHFYAKGMSNELRLNEIQNLRINEQIEQFTTAQNVKLTSQENEIFRLQSAIVTDTEIIKMKTEMLVVIEDQFTNGIITQREYLEELEQVTLSKNSLALHEVQLAQAIIQYQLFLGTL
ncbi:MAG TPA: TolC family protein [Saprospiraceae bacterium]|nr:TolC family protein [Saprospiraceae bacterium]